MKRSSFCFSLIALFFSAAIFCAEQDGLTKMRAERQQRVWADRIQKAEEATKLLDEFIAKKKAEQTLAHKLHHMAADNDLRECPLAKQADFYPIKFYTISDPSKDGVDFISMDVD